MHADKVVLWAVLVFFAGWATVADSVEMCACPNPPAYGVVPLFEKVTSALCGAVLYAPPELNALSQGIKAGCAQLAATELRGTLTQISELTSTTQELLNSTLLPNCQQGLALKRQWDATSDPAQRAALEAEWAPGLFNVTVHVSAALAQVLGRYTQTLLQLRQNLTTAAVADFASGGLDACNRVNHSQTQLESELAYWEAVLKNCSGVPEVCTYAKERIANVTARVDALAPSVRFCAAFAPGLTQAYQGYRAVDLDLQQLINGLELGLQNPLQYVATMLQQTCATLSSPTFLLGMTAVLSNLNENTRTDILRHDICVIEAVPC
jgi:hypothetical protein